MTVAVVTVVVEVAGVVVAAEAIVPKDAVTVAGAAILVIEVLAVEEVDV